MGIRTIIIDDTPLAVEKLKGFVKQVPLLEMLQSFNNGLDALHFIQTTDVDLIFLDIQMEEFTGLQFLDALQNPPQIVIVSAYSEYAIKGFEHNVTDYLLKPYSLERFLKAIDKVIKQNKVSLVKNFMFVKTEYRMERIDFADVLWITGKGAYLQIMRKDKSKIMTLMTFEQILAQLPSDSFIRVHRSYIVALNKINSVERNCIVIEKERIPIGGSYLDDFMNRIYE